MHSPPVTKSPKVPKLISIFKQPIAIILLIFGLIFCSISFVNHYDFRTYAFDLGIFNNEMYDNAHFRLNHYSIAKEYFSSPFADHFSFVIPIISPLYWIFKSYTLLVVQIFAILFGAYGVFMYFKGMNPVNTWLPKAAAIHFLSIWGIYSALGFDYHDNVIAAMLVPWFIYFFEKRSVKYSIIFLALILITKENMALWSAFICLGLALLHSKDKQLIVRAILYSVVSFAYFIVAIKFIIPRLGTHPELGYYHFKYSALGASVGEAIQTIVFHPIHFLKLFFVNHISDPEGDGIKRELFLTLLFSGGFFLLLKPEFLLMLVPILAQKLLSDDFGKWGLNGQYCIEFVPILTMCAFSYISRFKSHALSLVFTVAICVATGLTTFYKLEYRISKYYNPVNEQFYTHKHYTCEFNRKKIAEAISAIPDTAIVSASCQLVPHLSFRPKIYQFPVVDDADYVALLDGETTYPISKENLKAKIKEYLVSLEWTTIYSSGQIYVFHKSINKGIVITDTLVSNVVFPGSVNTKSSDTLNRIGYSMEGHEYSPTIEYNCEKFIDKVVVQLFSRILFRLTEPYQLAENAVYLVASIEANGTSYFYSCVDLAKSDIIQNGFGNAKISLDLPEFKPNSVLKIYIWNRGNASFTLFNLNLVETIKKQEFFK